VLTLIACGGGEGEARTEYARIEAGGVLDQYPIGLCALVRHPMFGSAGLYEVEALEGVVEDDLRNPGDRAGFTYVELALVDGWWSAEQSPVARVLGGPWPSGDSGGWHVSLAVGERVGLLLVNPVAENRGHHDLHNLGVFNAPENGGYSNGQLFKDRRVGAGELGELIEGLAGEDLEADCPYDELPE